MLIPIERIKPSPHPVRTTSDETKLDELVQSIRENGVIVPIKVKHTSDGYEIIYGHRRAEAARRAGLTHIEATVDDLSDTDTQIQALIENVQREDMSAMDTARGLQALKDVTGWSQREMERRGIMNASSIKDFLALLAQPVRVQELMTAEDFRTAPITPYHVKETREVLHNDTDKIAVLEKAAREELTASQTRKVAEAVAAAPSPQAKEKLLKWDYSPSVHDPVYIKERAQEFGAHDPMYREHVAVTPTQDWKNAPEVSAVISTLKSWGDQIVSLRRTAEVGKMSPEAHRFIARRVRTLADALIVWADELETE